MADTPEHQSRPIRSLYADDPEMADLVETFVSDMPARVEALRAAWEDGKVPLLKRLAHQLSGSCAGYGFPAVGRAARELEHRLTALDQSEADLQALAREFEGLIEMCARTSSQQHQA